MIDKTIGNIAVVFVTIFVSEKFPVILIKLPIIKVNIRMNKLPTAHAINAQSAFINISEIVIFFGQNAIFFILKYII
jgi:hypothetical protein